VCAIERGRTPAEAGRYCAADIRVGTMRCTLIAERSMSSPTWGEILVFQTSDS
jgi:hypothetical protein